MAFVAAFRDLGRERGKGVLIELMLLLGIVVVCANLVAAMGAVSLLARSFLGLDIAVVEAFFSTDNTFVLLVLGAISAVALEPLRAAVSAMLYVEARARRDGFDLAAAVRALAPLGSRGAGAALVLTLSLGVCSFAVAQEPPSDMPAAEPLEDEALTPRDWAVLDGVDAALARSEFEEHSGVRRGQSIRALVERFFDWLLRNRDLDLEREGNSGPKLGMPPASVFVAIACALLAVVTIAAWSARKRATAETSEDTGEAAAEADPRDRPPESHLDEAAQLAASGAYREAFRALYLATLVALDRRGAIAFDRSRTNWHYLRSMRGGPTREAFHRFTALFDRKWYGDEATSELDYRLGRELADSICASASGGST
ncbi:MAG: DUF4129 domain-containing protein [Polyangiaceae bacterium]|nr:DUF4129 domain-containing protein [Polyangiaceae bacterium]